MHYALLLLLPLLPQLSRCQSPPNSTSVTCQPGFQWASNSAQQSPCAVAAATIFACSAPLFIPPLQTGTHYSAPGENGEPLNLCSCSWAAYNLASACTACQGDSGSILPFESYTADCTSESGEGSTVVTTYFPSNIVPLDNTSIPYYATMNPHQWEYGIFNITQAQNISSQGFQDITFGTTSSTSSTAKPRNSPVAAIAGGLAGGFVLLFIIAVIVFQILRKRRKHDVSDSESNSPTMQFTMELPNTSMDIIPYTLSPPLAFARMKTSNSTDGNHPIDRETTPDTQAGPPQSQTHEQGEPLQVSPPAYSELFNSECGNVAETTPGLLSQEPLHPLQTYFDSEK